jgi:hypothetical protein
MALATEPRNLVSSGSDSDSMSVSAATPAAAKMPAFNTDLQFMMETLLKVDVLTNALTNAGASAWRS